MHKRAVGSDRCYGESDRCYGESGGCYNRVLQVMATDRGPLDMVRTEIGDF